jgi:hypothetical protein
MNAVSAFLLIAIGLTGQRSERGTNRRQMSCTKQLFCPIDVAWLIEEPIQEPHFAIVSLHLHTVLVIDSHYRLISLLTPFPHFPHSFFTLPSLLALDLAPTLAATHAIVPATPSRQRHRATRSP